MLLLTLLYLVTSIQYSCIAKSGNYHRLIILCRQTSIITARTLDFAIKMSISFCEPGG